MLGDRAAVIAGQDTSTDPTCHPAGRHRRAPPRRHRFGLPNNNTSYTYTATGTIPPDDPQGAGGQPPRQLLPAGTAGHQTVAVLTGAASVTASSAGSWLWEVPQGDPVNAFDGDPSTAWTEASPGSADGQWIQINFTHPLHLSGPLTVRLLDDIPRPVATRLVITTAAGRAATGTRVTGAPQPVSVPSGTTSWLRITIAATRGGTPGGPGAGISEVTIPGVRVTRFLQPSQDQAGPTPSFSFHRESSSTFGLPGAPPEPALDRTFTVPAAQRFTVSASVTAVPGAALNALLDRVGSGTPAQLHITASSTFGSLPALRPQNLLENGGNGWVAAGPDATLHLQWKGQRTIDEIDLVAPTVGIAAEPTRVLITSPGGTRDVPVPQSGVLRFPALITDQLDISFPGVMPTTSYNPLVGQAQQLPVGLASLSVPALAGLSTGIPAPAAPFQLGCGQGPPVTVDGHTYPTSVSGTVNDLTDFTPLPLHLCTKGAALTLSAGQALADLAGDRRAARRHRPEPPHVHGFTHRRAVRGISATTDRLMGSRIPHGDDRSRQPVLPGGSPGGQPGLDRHPQRAPAHAGDPGRLAAGLLGAGGAGGQVAMTFAPATGYRWLLAGSALAICVLIAAAVWPSRRRPRLRPRHAAADLAGPALTEIRLASTRLGTGSRWRPRRWCWPWSAGRWWPRSRWCSCWAGGGRDGCRGWPLPRCASRARWP